MVDHARPLVSIVIPTFNRSDTISRAIKSVLNQTYQEIEVIVVDDGSTDRTAEKLQEFAGRINVIYQRNKGPSSARNVGVNASSGEIVSFLDSDDVWLPGKLAGQIELMQSK